MRGWQGDVEAAAPASSGSFIGSLGAAPEDEVCAQAGLFVDDEHGAEGPLRPWVSPEHAEALGETGNCQLNERDGIQSLPPKTRYSRR